MASIECSNCKICNPITLKFCRECGYWLNASTTLKEQHRHETEKKRTASLPLDATPTSSPGKNSPKPNKVSIRNSFPMTEPREIFKTGYLNKLGGWRGKKWKRKWCVLEKGILYYAKKDGDHLCKFISLENSKLQVKILNHKGFTFRIINYSGKCHSLQAPNLEELEDWVENLITCGATVCYSEAGGMDSPSLQGSPSLAPLEKPNNTPSPIQIGRERAPNHRRNSIMQRTLLNNVLSAEDLCQPKVPQNLTYGGLPDVPPHVAQARQEQNQTYGYDGMPQLPKNNRYYYVCRSCESHWPLNVLFCGDCGVKLLEIE